MSSSLPRICERPARVSVELCRNRPCDAEAVAVGRVLNPRGMPRPSLPSRCPADRAVGVTRRTPRCARRSAAHPGATERMPSTISAEERVRFSTGLPYRARAVCAPMNSWPMLAVSVLARRLILIRRSASIFAALGVLIKLADVAVVHHRIVLPRS